MNLTEYQTAAARTINNKQPAVNNINNFVYGLVGETGEVVDILKKHMFHDHPLDKIALKKELGDVLWYVSALTTIFNLSLNDVAETNIKKLLKRYPNGFNSKDSINRSV
jgi:NTP pyrophosphatase (non-canonical NTP hydrolase)